MIFSKLCFKIIFKHNFFTPDLRSKLYGENFHIYQKKQILNFDSIYFQYFRLKFRRKTSKNNKLLFVQEAVF